MNVKAPVATIGGDGFERQVKSVMLKDSGDAKYAGYVEQLVISVAPYI